MLSKAQNKHIRSLTQQKFRDEFRLFTAEGNKIAIEWLGSSQPVRTIIATVAWAAQNHDLIAGHPEADMHIASETEIAALSALAAQDQVLLILPYPETKAVPKLNQWYLALDGLQDPGNMGTIIRIADWFGIQHVICSPGCVNAYNPKVVQSAMGGHLRVTVYEADLLLALPALGLPVFAATPGGDNIYDIQAGDSGVLVIGNESKGISEQVMNIANRRIAIPRKGGAESLNAAVSAGILCALVLPR